MCPRSRGNSFRSRFGTAEQRFPGPTGRLCAPDIGALHPVVSRTHSRLDSVFFDRGIPDTLGYARLIDLRDDKFIRNACDPYRYEPIVFLAPAWKEIYETDSERKQDFAEAERTCVLLAQIYRECGYEVLEIPKAAAQERAEFVVKHVKRATAPESAG